MTEKISYVPIILMVLNMLLPYGVFGFPTWIFSTVQVWFFPFWYYSYDQYWGGPWEGRISNVFTEPLYGLPLVPLGILWFVLGLAASKLLQELYVGNVQRLLVILLLVGSLVSQTMMIFIVLAEMNIITLDYVIPLPIHTIFVLVLSIVIPVRRKE